MHGAANQDLGRPWLGRVWPGILIVLLPLVDRFIEAGNPEMVHSGSLLNLSGKVNRENDCLQAPLKGNGLQFSVTWVCKSLRPRVRGG
jgi:hypothetical protein